MPKPADQDPDWELLGPTEDKYLLTSSAENLDIVAYFASLFGPSAATHFDLVRVDYTIGSSLIAR